MESEEVFEFRTGSQQIASFAKFADMRKSGKLCDVVLRVGTVRITAHRLVLASSIPYFEVMFTCDMKESKMTEITMSDVDPEALQCAIDFVYSGYLRITSDKVIPLLKTSSYLQLDSISDACLEFLWKRIEPSNAFTTRECVYLTRNLNMAEKADRFIRENFDDVCMSQEFLQLSFATLRKIICRDDLNILDEEVIFESVVRWVKASEDERKQLLPELLLCVRMPLLKQRYLTTRVRSEGLIKPSVFEEIMKEVKNYRESRPCRFGTLERRCRETHHFKCAKQTGYGKYFVSQKTDSTVSFGYHDRKHGTWHQLCEINHQHPHYVVCTKESIYFIQELWIYVLDLKTIQLSSVKITETPLCAGIALHNNQIYLFGGSDRNEVTSYKIFHLDIENAKYLEIGTMRKRRNFPATASIGNRIYLTGGLHEGFLRMRRSAERYCLNTGLSTEISSMLSRRCWHGSTSLEGKIYVCGGYIKIGSLGHHPTSSCEVYDTSTDQWNYISKRNSEGPSTSLLAVGNKLHMIGTTEVGDLKGFLHETYDPNEDEWKSEHQVIFHPEYVTTTILLTNTATLL